MNNQLLLSIFILFLMFFTGCSLSSQNENTSEPPLLSTSVKDESVIATLSPENFDSIDAIALIDDAIQKHSMLQYVHGSETNTMTLPNGVSGRTQTCLMDFLANAFICEIESISQPLNSTQTPSDSIQIMMKDGVYYDYHINDSWRTVHELDAWITELINFIDPTEYMGAVATANVIELIERDDTRVYEISYTVDFEKHFKASYGEESGSQAFALSQDLSFSGLIWIGKDDGHFYGFKSELGATFDNMVMEEHVSQAYSRFNEPVDIPDP